MPRVSLVVAAYNAQQYVGQLIESIRLQTLHEIEVVFVDDGSTDRTPDILDTAAAADDRFAVVHQQNAGQGTALNVGMARATGDVILCIDADDMLRSDLCEVVARGFEEHPGLDLMSFGFVCEPPERTPASIATELYPRDAYFEGFHPEVLFHEKVRPFAWRCAFSADFYRRSGAHYDPSLSLGADQFFLFYVYPRARKVLLCSKQLYHYRMSDQSMMHAASSDSHELGAKLRKHAAAVQAVLADWKAQGWQNVCTNEMLSWALDLVLLDAYSLPMGEQNAFWREYLGMLGAYFSPDAVAASPLHVRRVWEQASQSVTHLRRGACGSPATVALFYLRERGLANCVRRVVGSRF